MKIPDTTRENNLRRAFGNLEHAKRLITDMLNEPNTPHNVTDTPANGVQLLEKMGLIEVFHHDTRTHMDDDGDQQPLIVAITKK